MPIFFFFFNIATNFLINSIRSETKISCIVFIAWYVSSVQSLLVFILSYEGTTIDVRLEIIAYRSPIALRSNDLCKKRNTIVERHKYIRVKTNRRSGMIHSSYP